MKTFRERLRAGAYGSIPIISSFAFVVIVGLIVIFAAAEKKNEPLNAAVTALGAVGQVFFAGMVWQLSKEQFKFTRKVSDRQARIDAFSYRSEIIKGFEDWSEESLLEANMNGYLTLLRLLTRTKFLFGSKVDQVVRNLEVDYGIMVEASEELANGKKTDEGFETIFALSINLSKKSHTVLTSYRRLLRALHAEMQIEVPDFHSDTV